jgi:putative alpha-1,2-mannosidase
VPYVQDVSVNGQAWNKPWLRFADISHGGALVFDLSTNANTKWGSDPVAAPPSYDGGN